jgi:hypothetical protein
VQDPQRYEQLVRTAYAPGYQEQALREGEELRQKAATAVAEFGAGGTLIASVAARRVDSFDGSTAAVTSWTSAFGWGPNSEPTQFWSLNETSVRWDGQRWLVERLDEADRTAPAPSAVIADDEAKRTGTFERELRGFQAPQYGG